MTTVLILAAVGIMQFEGQRPGTFGSLGSALWWSLMLIVTGEMDTVPQSAEGRVLALFGILAGMTVFAIFTGIVSAVMVQRLRRHMDEKIVSIEDVRGQILICGWNRAGLRLVRELLADRSQPPRPVVVVAELAEADAAEVARLSPERVYVVRGDYTRVSVLEQAGVRHASTAVLLADRTADRSDQDRDARTVLAALTIEKMAPRVFTTVELINPDNESHLRIAGVEEVFVKATVTASFLAAISLNPGLGKLARSLFAGGIGTAVHRVPVPEQWTGIELARVFRGIKAQANAAVLGLEVDGNLELNPPLSRRLPRGSVLMLVAAAEPDLAAVSPEPL
ncbi:MAG: potassium channel protein [Candidatus Riflebacteria bacterium]|nr:potassium channel protein [Candidatus Riflebacteria bacterium]